MAEAEATEARETRSRTSLLRGWKLPRDRKVPWWAAPLALLVVAGFIGTGAIALTEHAGPVETWSAISFNFGSNPVTNVLNISFARVAFLSQPTQWNTSGFINASLTKPAGATWNSTDYGTNYGVLSINSTSSLVTDAASWPVSGELGANVSYVFTDQRAALNGTGTTWQYVIGESKITAAAATTGSVLSSAAGSAQNDIVVQATYASGVYSFEAYDWEYKTGAGGPYQNVTAYAIGTAANQAPLSFFEVYVYAQPTQTVVSIVNTTDGAVYASSPVMHPVLDKNLTSVAYLGDTLTAAASSTGSSAIMDSAYLVDHNTYTGATCGSAPVTAVTPLVTGAISPGTASPFDPSSVAASQTISPSGTSSFSNTNVKLNDFPSVENSSSQDMMTAASINSSYLVPVDGIGSGVKNLTLTTPATISPEQAVTTLRAAGESTQNGASVDLYTTSWTPSAINSGIMSFLQNYVSAKTGILASCVHIPSYFVNNIAVDTTFSAQAASTVHDYIASAIPGILSSNNLALVNTQTGAIEAGADIGSFMDLASGQVLPARVSVSSYGSYQVYDPVNGATYSSAVAAGFPVGSTLSAAGAITVPDQAPFLGFSASGIPEFGVGGCFLVCLPSSLSGAASAVSSYLATGASSVANSLSTVSSSATTAVLKPVTGTMTTDLAGAVSDISGTISSVMPAAGGTLANVGADISGTLTHTLSGVSSGIASATDSIAGSLAAGLSSASTTLYHVGALAGSYVAQGATSIEQGLSVVGNTLGKTVSTAAAVASNAFLSTANVLGQTGSEALAAIKSGLSTVGSVMTQIGSTLLDAIEAPLKALGALFSWPTALSSGVSLLLEMAVIGIVVASCRRRQEDPDKGGRSKSRCAGRAGPPRLARGEGWGPFWPSS